MILLQTALKIDFTNQDLFPQQPPYLVQGFSMLDFNEAFLPSGVTHQSKAGMNIMRKEGGGIMPPSNNQMIPQWSMVV